MATNEKRIKEIESELSGMASRGMAGTSERSHELKLLFEYAELKDISVYEAICEIKKCQKR